MSKAKDIPGQDPKFRTEPCVEARSDIQRTMIAQYTCHPYLAHPLDEEESEERKEVKKGGENDAMRMDERMEMRGSGEAEKSSDKIVKESKDIDSKKAKYNIGSADGKKGQAGEGNQVRMDGKTKKLFVPPVSTFTCQTVEKESIKANKKCSLDLMLEKKVADTEEESQRKRVAAFSEDERGWEKVLVALDEEGDTEQGGSRKKRKESSSSVTLSTNASHPSGPEKESIYARLARSREIALAQDPLLQALTQERAEAVAQGKESDTSSRKQAWLKKASQADRPESPTTPWLTASHAWARRGHGRFRRGSLGRGQGMGLLGESRRSSRNESKDMDNDTDPRNRRTLIQSLGVGASSDLPSSPSSPKVCSYKPTPFSQPHLDPVDEKKSTKRTSTPTHLTRTPASTPSLSKSVKRSHDEQIKALWYPEG